MPKRAYALLAVATLVVAIFAGTVFYRLHSRESLSDGGTAQEYSSSDVAIHNQTSDCWIIVGAKVYNLTPYLATHTDDTTFSKLCGDDATQALNANVSNAESAKLQKLIQPYYIGLATP